MLHQNLQLKKYFPIPHKCLTVTVNANARLPHKGNISRASSFFFDTKGPAERYGRMFIVREDQFGP